MEIVSSIGVLVSPFLIKWITSGVKQFSGAADWKSGYRNIVLKLVVVVLSFGATVGTAALNGSEVDAGTISTLAETVLVFVASTGFYYWSKYRKLRP